jgi:hypothetical protein
MLDVNERRSEENGDVRNAFLQSRRITNVMKTLGKKWVEQISI